MSEQYWFAPCSVFAGISALEALGQVQIFIPWVSLGAHVLTLQAASFSKHPGPLF